MDIRDVVDTYRTTKMAEYRQYIERRDKLTSRVNEAIRRADLAFTPHTEYMRGTVRITHRCLPPLWAEFNKEGKVEWYIGPYHESAAPAWQYGVSVYEAGFYAHPNFLGQDVIKSWAYPFDNHNCIGEFGETLWTLSVFVATAVIILLGVYVSPLLYMLAPVAWAVWGWRARKMRKQCAGFYRDMHDAYAVLKQYG